MNKAIEAATEAVDLTAYAVYFASHGGKEMTEIENPEETARAAISAYLQALASDDETVEAVATSIEVTAQIIAEGGEDDGIANPADCARAALSALRGKV